jgi:hypothetical protein
MHRLLRGLEAHRHDALDLIVERSMSSPTFGQMAGLPLVRSQDGPIEPLALDLATSLSNRPVQT